MKVADFVQKRVEQALRDSDDNGGDDGFIDNTTRATSERTDPVEDSE